MNKYIDLTVAVEYNEDATLKKYQGAQTQLISILNLLVGWNYSVESFWTLSKNKI